MSKTKTPAHWLAKPCPSCRAQAGERCKNYLGKGKATCLERIPPEDLTKQRRAKAWDRSKAKAQKLNDQAEAAEAEAREQAPLFADQMGPPPARVEPEALYRHWQSVKAVGVENCAEESAIKGGWDTWQNWVLVDLARRHLSPEVFALLMQKATGRWFSYPVMFWKDRLSTLKPVCLRLDAEELGQKECTGQDGTPFTVPIRRVYETEHFPYLPGWAPPFTPEELEARLQIPPPADFAGAIDPCHLAEVPA